MNKLRFAAFRFRCTPVGYSTHERPSQPSSCRLMIASGVCAGRLLWRFVHSIEVSRNLERPLYRSRFSLTVVSVLAQSSVLLDQVVLADAMAESSQVLFSSLAHT